MALPSDEQRRALCEMMAQAFVEMRLLGGAGRATQCADLAGAFHNLPREIWGWGKWDPRDFRKRLVQYQATYHGEDYIGRVDYVAGLDALFPQAPRE